jgi:calcineurin-like phosphoesterase
VINLASRTVLPLVSEPLPTLDIQLVIWVETNAVDMVLVDFHGESVMEKMALGFAAAGRVAAVVGTHTHVGTCDTHILPMGTAFVTDVGMTGPGGGLQGYDPAQFVDAMQRNREPGPPKRMAPGDIEFGAVLITVENGCAVAIERFYTRVSMKHKGA